MSQKIYNNKTRGKVINTAEETFFFLSYTQKVPANIRRKNKAVFAGRPQSTSLEIEGCKTLCESSQERAPGRTTLVMVTTSSNGLSETHKPQRLAEATVHHSLLAFF